MDNSEVIFVVFLAIDVVSQQVCYIFDRPKK